MHTKDNQPVAKGDKLWLQIEVTDVSTNPEFCNCSGQTVEKMFPGDNTVHVGPLNTKQLLKNPPIPMMNTVRGQVVDFNFMDAVAYAKKAVKVLQQAGDLAIEVVVAGFAMYTAFTDRDLTGLFANLKVAGTDVQKIIAIIKAEFQLE